jgi:DNA-binding beta-propeller fold protein YncE
MYANRGLVALSLLLLCACEDPEAPRITGSEFGVVVSSIDRVLHIFSVDSPQAAVPVGLAPEGSPVTLAVRKQFAVVPLGTFPAAAVVDLAQRRVVHTVPLPTNSGATGAAFLNDSIALVGNPNLNTVTPINILRGTAAAAIRVGTFPQFILATGDTAFVVNAELVNFQPARNGTISVITGTPPQVVATIPLIGTNPGSAAVGRDGLLYVLNSGSYGQNNSVLSVVDRRTLQEVMGATGFGDFPGAVAAAGDGRLYIASFGYGVAVWDPGTRNFVRAPTAAVQPGGIAGASGLGIDEDGRVYVLKPDCSNPSTVFRLNAAYVVEREIAVGICPFSIGFTRFQPTTP